MKAAFRSLPVSYSPSNTFSRQIKAAHRTGEASPPWRMPSCLPCRHSWQRPQHKLTPEPMSATGLRQIKSKNAQLTQLSLKSLSRVERVQVLTVPLLVGDQAAFVEPNNHNRISGSPGLEDNDFGAGPCHSLRRPVEIRHRKKVPPRTTRNRLPSPTRHDFVESHHRREHLASEV